MDPEELEELKNNFNAVLTSGGGSLSERQFLSDYRSLIGILPYQKYGFRDLRSFVESLGFYYSRNASGEASINASFDPKTAHISSLIARQKKKPGKSKKRTSSYARPKLPPRLTQLPRRSNPYPSYLSGSGPSRAPISYLSGSGPSRAPISYLSGSVPSRAPIQPPKPKYGNPPIIPQRQPLVERRLEINTPPASAPVRLTSAQDRLSREALQRPSVDVGSAQSRIFSVNSPEANLPSVGQCSIDVTTSCKEESLVEEPSEDASYIDIQWLQGKVLTNGKLEKDRAVVKEAHAAYNSSKVVKDVSSEPAKKSLSSPIEESYQKQVVQLPPSQSTQSSPPPLMSLQVVKPPKSRTRLDQKVVFKSHVEELANLVLALNLENPEYKYIERRPFKNKPVYVAKVKVGKELFISYPVEKPTTEEAQEYVAKIACEALRKRVLEPKSSEDVDEVVLEERVYKIVETKSNGMFDEAIGQAYEEEFGTSLPPTWLEVIETSDNFSVQRFNQKAIVYPIPKEQVKSTVVKIDTTIGATHLHSVDINANTLCSKDALRRELPELVLPQSATWDVFVSSISSSDYVWVRLIGEDYDAVYNNVMNELELKMCTADGQMVSSPQVDDYYVVKFDNCMLRVQLKKIIPGGSDGEDECVVFLIDNGEEDTIPVSELRVLENEFLTVPPQAIKCRLAYIDLTYNEAQLYMQNHVIGSSFVAEVMHSPLEKQVPTLVLYNTAVEEPININYCILDAVIKKLEPPRLPQGNKVVFLSRITYVDKETPPFIQIQGRDLELLENILCELCNQDLIQLHGVNAHPRLMHVSPKDKHMYLVRSTQTLRRATIVNIDDPRNPLVHFIDHGNTGRVMMSDIFDLEKVLPALSKLPAQAVQVNMTNLASSQLVGGVVKRLKELAPPSTFIFTKVTEVGSGDKLPSVEFFKRVPPENIICSINGDLVFNMEEYSIPIAEEEQVQLAPSHTIKNRGNPLIPYTVPAAGEIMDIYVSMSSNPNNFVVQPVKELLAFNAMMQELQDLYETQHHIMPLPLIDEIRENAAFAAKHPDDFQWYRVSIVTTLSDTMVSVKYSDYGDLGLLSLDRLRYLEPIFKEMPALSMRVKLHGVKPKNCDWSVEDCVFFNNLVEGKAFVSKVLEVNNDSSSNVWRLSLQIIDTSNPNEDVDIATQLVEAGIAELV